MEEAPASEKSTTPPVLTSEEVVILVSHLPDRHHAVAAKLLRLYAWLVTDGAAHSR